MNLEIVFKPETETENTVAIDFIELSKKDRVFNLDWDESQHWTDIDGSHHLYAKGVYINGEYGNGKIAELKNSNISAMQLYNYETETEEFSCKVLQFEIYDNEKSYAFPEESFGEFREREEIDKEK